LPPVAAAPPASPTIVVREVPRLDPFTQALFGGGALGAGFAIGMFLRSSATRDDAATAGTLTDANALHDRADRDRLIAVVAGGISAAAIGFAVVRWVRAGPSTQVAVQPTTGGSMIVLSTAW
jgi:hypothetical protein